MSDPVPPRRLHLGYWMRALPPSPSPRCSSSVSPRLADRPSLPTVSCPAIRPCRAAARPFAGEATVGPLWYRAVNLGCGKESVHLIYVKRGTGPGWFAFPAVMSVGDPAPLSVDKPAPTRSRLCCRSRSRRSHRPPIAFDRNGIPRRCSRATTAARRTPSRWAAADAPARRVDAVAAAVRRVLITPRAARSPLGPMR